MAVAKGSGEEETGKLLFKMVEFQFYKRIRVMEKDGGDSRTTL